MIGSRKSSARSQAPEPQPQPSSHDVQKFKVAEAERSVVFDSQLRELEFDFIQENRVWETSIDKRNSVFQEFRRKRQDMFHAQRSNFAHLFEQSESIRSQTFKDNNSKRTSLFEILFTKHETLFTAALEEFSMKQQWYLQTIETLSSANRLRRESRGDCMIETMSTEFSTFLDGFREQVNYDYGPKAREPLSVSPWVVRPLDRRPRGPLVSVEL